MSNPTQIITEDIVIRIDAGVLTVYRKKVPTGNPNPNPNPIQVMIIDADVNDLEDEKEFKFLAAEFAKVENEYQIIA